MKQYTFYIIAIIAALVIMFVPMGRKQKGPHQERLKLEEYDPFYNYLNEGDHSGFSPVLDLFKTKDIVFLGEFYKVTQGLEYAEKLIPELYSNGVRSLGIEYALSVDQAEIDRIVTAEVYDEDAVKQVLFNRMVLWGFQEYADLFKAVWSLNSGLAADEPQFRLIGLNVEHDWSHIQSQEDGQDPELLRKVLAKGLPDVHMAEVVRIEILEKGEKALVLTGAQHAVTRYRSVRYKENMTENGFNETRRLGNLIYDYTGGRAATALFHSPWPDSREPQGYGYALRGVIDQVLDLLPEEKRHAAFYVGDSPINDVQIVRSEYAYGYEDLSFADLCDVYILTGAIRDFTPCTVMAGFITENNISETLANFPGPAPEEIGADEVISYLWEEMEGLAKLVELF